ncbi:hypothetical protein BD626DRAFT_574761 [Schizophyllum amplum]|uniref:Uncharacterized protein n=1 Tax=Schizophyllum amplum TaxID=97359 RepID=A0A550BXB5_9AGAR|nr:hypothetical protein BD626DRAFT_574761 [Auriculariopsis ampla]
MLTDWGTTWGEYFILEQLTHWAALCAHMRIYTLEMFLREKGHEDVLSRIPEDIWGVLVAPPESQNFATHLLFAASVPPLGPTHPR